MSLRDARPLLRSCRPCFHSEPKEQAKSFCAKPSSHERTLGSCAMPNAPRLQDLALFLSDLLGLQGFAPSFAPRLHRTARALVSKLRMYRGLWSRASQDCLKHHTMMLMQIAEHGKHIMSGVAGVAPASASSSGGACDTAATASADVAEAAQRHSAVASGSSTWPSSPTGTRQGKEHCQEDQNMP